MRSRSYLGDLTLFLHPNNLVYLYNSLKISVSSYETNNSYNDGAPCSENMFQKFHFLFFRNDELIYLVATA